MSTLTNSITIAAAAAQVWAILAKLDELAEYDPTVGGVAVAPGQVTGVGAARRVTMSDGKHWFEERLSLSRPHHALAFELTACNLPVSRLTHTYALTESGGYTTVTQVMEYTPRFGPAGRLLDRALGRGFDAGIKQFLEGLKSHAETRLV
jgi:uncharacterized protein YndB with AHSA1/START domain